jgi:hypothetical protein
MYIRLSLDDYNKFFVIIDDNSGTKFLLPAMCLVQPPDGNFLSALTDISYLLFMIYLLILLSLWLDAFRYKACMPCSNGEKDRCGTSACGGINNQKEQLWTKKPEENFLK